MKPKIFPLGLALVCALALFLRLYDLGAESFWGDEINMIRFSRGERPLELSFGNALLYLPLLRLFGGDGASEFAFRLPAALFGAATVPLVALLGLRWDGRRSAALLAALFVALAPAHLALSQETHSYAAFVFFVVAALLCAERAGRGGGWIPWLGFAALAGIATHLHLFLFFLMPPLFGAALLARGHLRRPTRQELAWGASASALYLLIVSPLLWRWVLPLLGGLVAKTSGAQDTGVDYFDSHKHLFQIDLELFAKAFRELIAWRGPFLVVIGAAAALLLLGLWALYRRRPASAGLILLFVVLALPPITYFSWQSGIDFGTRRLLFLLPLFALALAAGCLELGRLLAAALRRPADAELAGVAAGLVAALVYGGSATAGYYFGETKWDLRSTGRLIDLEAKPGDEILVFTLDRLSLYRPPKKEDGFGLHEVWWYRKNLNLEQLPPRLMVFWPAAFVADRFGELDAMLKARGAIDIPLGTGFQLTVLERDGSPAERRAKARELVERLIAIKGERPYLRARLATLHLEDGHQQEAMAEQAKADRRSLRGRFPTRYFFFGW